MSPSIPPILSYYKGTIKELCRINKTYGHWQDYLSLSLLEWIRKFPSEFPLCSPTSQQRLTSQQIQDIVRIKLDELRQKILVNPLNVALPLTEPVLDGLWTWERSWLVNCHTLSHVSHLTKQPFETEIRVHLFAVDMIAWATRLAELHGIKSTCSDLVNIVTPTTLFTSLAPLNLEGDSVLKEQAKKCLNAFLNLSAEYAIETQEESTKRRLCESYTQELKTIDVQTQKNIAHQKIESEKRERAFKAAAEESLKATEMSQKYQCEALQRQLDQLEIEEKIAEARLASSQKIETQLSAEVAAARRRN